MIRTWIVCLATIAGIITVVFSPFVKSGFGLTYNAFVTFSVLAIAGGIPSAVIAFVVSCLTFWLEDERDKYESYVILIVVLGTISGLAVSIPAPPVGHEGDGRFLDRISRTRERE